MDSFEVNKILGAILATCLGVLSINIAAGAIFAPVKPAKPGYEIGVPEQAPAGKPAEQEKQESIEQLLAKADVARGENAVKKCQACHTFTKGGRNLIGPNLWGVIGRPKASEAGFNYSAALKAKGGNWTIDDLNVHQQSARLYSRHQHDLRRHPAWQRARRRHRLSQLALRQPGTAAQGGRGRRQPKGAMKEPRSAVAAPYRLL